MELMINLKNRGYVHFNFLELYPIRKSRDVPSEECSTCFLAHLCHPMRLVEEDNRSQVFELYCTKDFLKYGYIKAKDIV